MPIDLEYKIPEIFIVTRFKLHKQFRLPYYNYASSGLYFVTICTDRRKNIFGKIIKSEIELSKIGQYLEECIQNLSKKLKYVFVDDFVIMPNHVHIIISIDNPDEEFAIKEKEFRPRRGSLSIVVRNLKSTVTLLARRTQPDIIVWQKRFYDRIIRNENELHRVRKYIRDNPMQWEEDRNNPENLNI